MPRSAKNTRTLEELLDASSRPIYAIDGHRRIVYCNAALTDWLELKRERVLGRLVEYHSEPPDDRASAGQGEAPLADLCPPPRALAGQACSGTISCVARGGHLAHRRAEFVPLNAPAGPRRETTGGSLLVLLAERDTTPEELATEVSVEPTPDALHRIIRRFRRGQAARYAVETLLGDSSAAQRIRAQVTAAAESGANALIAGRSGSGRGQVARAIHYRSTGEQTARLVPIDCAQASDEQVRRAIDAVGGSPDDSRQRPTLLLENVDRLQPAQQAVVLAAIRHATFRGRVLATCCSEMSDADGASAIEPALRDALSTITITVPRLIERISDLPILAQVFLEGCNRGVKQVGSLRGDALDQLALYAWPGELRELQSVIAMAHERSETHEIAPADLPAVVYHASQAAQRQPNRVRPVVLDDLLGQIEREAITRALAQAGGNKTEAAALLGMTRPRLYRRLVQLGFVTEPSDAEPQLPEFIEQPADDATP